MTDHSQIVKSVTGFIEVTAKTPKQFAELQPLYLLDEAKNFVFDRDGNEKLEKINGYSFCPWEKNEEIKSYLKENDKYFFEHLRAISSWVLPTAYVNNTDEDKKLVYATILTRVLEKFFLTDVLSTANKFMCVGGPLTNTSQCQADAGDEYLMYNANSSGYTGRRSRFKRPSAILVHKTMIGG